MIRTTLCILALVLAVGCSKKRDDAGNNKGSATSPPAAAPSGAPYLSVGAYCDAFCQKLCSTCGTGDCNTSCTTRCRFGREPGMMLDGKDPTKGLALTQKDLDACVATITAESCPKILGGEVPDACHTIQH